MNIRIVSFTQKKSVFFGDIYTFASLNTENIINYPLLPPLNIFNLRLICFTAVHTITAEAFIPFFINFIQCSTLDSPMGTSSKVLNTFGDIRPALITNRGVNFARHPKFRARLRNIPTTRLVKRAHPLYPFHSVLFHGGRQIYPYSAFSGTVLSLGSASERTPRRCSDAVSDKNLT